MSQHAPHKVPPARSFLTFRMSRSFLAILVLSALALAVVSQRLRQQNDPVAQQDARAHVALAAVAGYVDNAVIKTIEMLAAEAEQLNRASQNLQAERSPAHLDAMVSAWHAAYGIWKTTSPYLYGPAAQYDYWKRLATWPCDKVLIDHAILQLEAGELAVDSRYLREEEVAALRGFYTLQYLLFQNGVPRAVTDFTAAEVDYMVAVTQALFEESVDFEATWRGTKNLSAEKAAVLKNAGLKPRESYGDAFKNPGTPGNPYTSLSISYQDLFQDISGVLSDEIVPGVAELLEGEDRGEMAYWDSIDPYADLLHLLQGVENAYLGGTPAVRTLGVTDFLAEHDPALDRLIRISFAHAYFRVAALRDSQGGTPEERNLAARIAEMEVEKLVARMSVAIPQVVLDPAVEPYAAYLK